jgi:DNA-directed RNA polymerase subunit beta'
MQTVKSDAGQNDEFWTALQAGEPLPAPRPTFAYKKFTSYLNALGVNVKKDGNNLQLIPFTDQQVKEMSNGEIKDAGLMVRAKDLHPEVGGLFDPKVTGGLDGTKWSHIRLAEIMPNPLFERSIQSLTGLDQKQYRDLVSGRKAIDKKGKLTTDLESGVTGGPAIALMLKKIDTQKGLADAQKALQGPNLKGNRLDQANKRVKYFTALNSAGLSPHDAYMMQYVPVLPPSMRPLSQLPNGDINNDDLNDLYKGVHLTSKKLEESSALLPEEEREGIRTELYDGLLALTGLSGHPTRTSRGILDIIGGKRVETSGGFATGKKLGSPKEGFFQNKLVKRKQDLSMRSTIVPEPSLGLDEVGIPRQAALEIYKPFVVRELRSMTGISPLEAQKQIKQGGELVNRALERVVSERPVLLKRDPVLHKYGIQAFKPRIVGGKAVQIHPLVTSGYNADFDGDAMSAFVPVGNAAVDEAKQMYPSRNLFSPSTGNLMYTPTLETQLGLYGITQSGKKTNHKFSDIKELHSAVDKGDVGFNDHVKVGGMDSTAGRFLVGEALPESMRASFLKDANPLDKGGQRTLLTEVATKHRNDYGEVVNKLKNLGNRWSTETAFSLGMEEIGRAHV